jgi:hypothetical protein
MFGLIMLMGESSTDIEVQSYICQRHEGQNINPNWSTTEFKGASGLLQIFLSETVTFAVWKIT